MNYWKLGCRWGAKQAGLPLFIDILQKHNIVISWVDKDYGFGNTVLLTDGQTSIGYAITKSIAKTLNEIPNLKSDFESKSISIESGLRIYDAEIFLIPEKLQFQYSLVQGICKIQQPEIINKLIHIINYTNKMEKTQSTTTLLKYKRQIILQGPPGTGKTRLAKEIAVEMLGLNNAKELENNKLFKLIQFHPSYTYEDFVRGIIAKPNEDGEGILYETENKTLGLFAKEALKNYNETNNISNDDSIGGWIDENFEDFKNEIETNLTDKEFTLSGEITIYKVQKKSFLYGKNWISPGHIKFEEFKKLVKAIIKEEIPLGATLLDKDKFVHSHYRSTYYNALLKKFFDKYHYTVKTTNVPPKNYILVIDEINRANLSSVLGELIYALEYRGEAVESMYDVDGKELILPPNLYIIGTMNTADRSVGHIDYAIRRRFAFVDVIPKDLTTELQDDFMIDKFNQVASLFVKDYDPELDYNNDSIIIEKSEHLTADFEPKDVWLGHSYFIQQYQEDENGNMQPINFNLRIKYEIKPILLEYIKDGILKESALKVINDIETHIADA
ncbi:AAA family ATPase [Elizabethkingia anophelis]|uniref:AAA family ATPase n=1 Tax=Elizabethkingia anophelis TaxID=1117645 RepID=UPI0021A4FA46|nr:AAA family ATPase [Elizabethkingia anophelis]MCT4056541.1 AAA family ATPase [Elizabethkingia anophelis]MCT4089027.1 AAA family ATPase [Elizabethkingia anophelis]MCT4103289.1 AAA family ATPase [Elizabethkingia anophelis]